MQTIPDDVLRRIMRHMNYRNTAALSATSRGIRNRTKNVVVDKAIQHFIETAVAGYPGKPWKSYGSFKVLTAPGRTFKQWRGCQVRLYDNLRFARIYGGCPGFREVGIDILRKLKASHNRNGNVNVSVEDGVGRSSTIKV